MADGSVAAHHLDRSVAGAVECLARPVREGLIEFYGGDVPAAAGELGQQRGVDTGRRADLQDASARLHVEQFEHPGDKVGAGRG